MTTKTIQRKPRKGDRIGFGRFGGVARNGGAFVSDVIEPTKPIATVLRIDGNLCWCSYDVEPNGHQPADGPFIWRFTPSGQAEHLNQLARIFDAAGVLIADESETVTCDA